jgi:4-alpha-glucanotransferase
VRASAPLEIDFHCWCQWQLDQQLAAVRDTARDAGMALGIVHDLAVGSDARGAETWADSRAYADGITIGAPPDAFNQQGQTWGSRPWRPDRLAETGYAPYRAMLRAVLRHADALRLDHVMGLFRLWWVPDGMPASAGTYVGYDHGAMLGTLALEASASGALVIGEDLGTVEKGVRAELNAWRAFGTSVLWFERDAAGGPLPPERWRRDCLATLSTHDLPTAASRLAADHVELRHRLGLIVDSLERERRNARAEVDDWLALLASAGLASAGLASAGLASAGLASAGLASAGLASGQAAIERHDTDSDDAGYRDAGSDDAMSETWRLILALHMLLTRSPCRLIGVYLPDVFGDRRPHNLPGTTGATYPNWRLPIADANGHPVLLDDMPSDPRLRALARALNSALARA